MTLKHLRHWKAHTNREELKEGANRKVSSGSSLGPSALGGEAGPVSSRNSCSLCYKDGHNLASRVFTSSVSNLCLPSVSRAPSLPLEGMLQLGGTSHKWRSSRHGQQVRSGRRVRASENCLPPLYRLNHKQHTRHWVSYINAPICRIYCREKKVAWLLAMSMLFICLLHSIIFSSIIFATCSI